MPIFGAFDVKVPVTISHGDSVDQLSIPAGRYEPESAEELAALRHVEEHVPGRVECIEEPGEEVDDAPSGLIADGDHSPTLSDPPAGSGETDGGAGDEGTDAKDETDGDSSQTDGDAGDEGTKAED